jgi:hypothetical protein
MKFPYISNFSHFPVTEEIPTHLQKIAGTPFRANSVNSSNVGPAARRGDNYLGYYGLVASTTKNAYLSYNMNEMINTITEPRFFIGFRLSQQALPGKTRAILTQYLDITSQTSNANLLQASDLTANGIPALALGGEIYVELDFDRAASVVRIWVNGTKIKDHALSSNHLTAWNGGGTFAIHIGSVVNVSGPAGSYAGPDIRDFYHMIPETVEEAQRLGPQIVRVKKIDTVSAPNYEVSNGTTVKEVLNRVDNERNQYATPYVKAGSDNAPMVVDFEPITTPGKINAVMVETCGYKASPAEAKIGLSLTNGVQTTEPVMTGFLTTATPRTELYRSLKNLSGGDWTAAQVNALTFTLDPAP